MWEELNDSEILQEQIEIQWQRRKKVKAKEVQKKSQESQQLWKASPKSCGG